MFRGPFLSGHGETRLTGSTDIKLLLIDDLTIIAPPCCAVRGSLVGATIDWWRSLARGHKSLFTKNVLRLTSWRAA